MNQAVEVTELPEITAISSKIHRRTLVILWMPGMTLRLVLTLWLGCFMCCAASLRAAEPTTQPDGPPAKSRRAPEFANVGEWINTRPLTMQELRGKVVVIHFWTFGCINCIHNLPHYQVWQRDFAGKDLIIIGIHTPETAAEKQVANVRINVKQREIIYPVVIDGEAAMWKAWGTRLWPSVALVDRRGDVRYTWQGELNWQGQKGEAQMRKWIEELLAERPAKN